MRGFPVNGVLAALVILAGGLLAPAAAAAQSGPTLRAPSFLACGSSLSIEGSGFTAEGHFRIFASTPSEARMVASVASDASGAFRVSVPALVRDEDCGATFTLTIVRSTDSPASNAIASTRVTYGSPAPANAGHGAPDGGDGAHPAIFVAALVLGVALLRTRSWLPGGTPATDASDDENEPSRV